MPKQFQVFPTQHHLSSNQFASRYQKCVWLIYMCTTIQYYFPNHHIMLNRLSLPSLTCVTPSGYNSNNSVSVILFQDHLACSPSWSFHYHHQFPWLPFQFISQAPLQSLISHVNLKCFKFSISSITFSPGAEMANLPVAVWVLGGQGV